MPLVDIGYLIQLLPSITNLLAVVLEGILKPDWETFDNILLIYFYCVI